MENWLISGLEHGKYQMVPEHVAVTKYKEVLKQKWRHIKRIKQLILQSSQLLKLEQLEQQNRYSNGL